jgi:hypothetical protein
MFRSYADECRRMADRTSDPTDKHSWLRLADSWLRMIQFAPKSAEDFTRDDGQSTRRSA